jgi:hypothetical protein
MIRSAATLAASLLLASPLARADAPIASKPYTITVGPTAAKKGDPAVAHVVLKPAAGFHVNKDFPISLKLTPPKTIDLPKAKLTKADATVSEQEAKFDVALTARESGKQMIEGTLSFAVCTATTCDPQRAPVQIAVEAK